MVDPRDSGHCVIGHVISVFIATRVIYSNSRVYTYVWALIFWGKLSFACGDGATDFGRNVLRAHRHQK